MSAEQPEYTVLAESAGVEYRQYEPYLVTQTLVKGVDNYKSAANEGFRRLFRYISGGNSSRAEIAMTKPVQQVAKGEKIAMTVPVQYSPAGSGYVISFMLPSQYTLETAPVPSDSRLQVVPIAGRIVAVVRYSGRWTSSNFTKYQSRLMAGLAEQSIESIGEVQSAFYNAPFMPPFLRRNEVMVEVSSVPAIESVNDSIVGVSGW